MKDETREFLDGERARPTLAPAAREEADAWDRLLTVLREDVPGPAPLWLEGAVMAEVAAARSRRVRRIAGWVLRPSLRLSPLGAGLAAAALAAALLAPWRGAPPPPVPFVAAAPEAPAVVYVQFVLEAPGARSVAVAGDFNGWDVSPGLSDPDGDGIWTGRVPVQPGVHQYMFVIDGSEWVTDPSAERWSDDGFGNRNAVVAVAPPDAA